MNTTDTEIRHHHQISGDAWRLKVFACLFAATLVLGFFIVRHMKEIGQRALVDFTSKEASAPPLVDVITVQNASASLPLTLPGETAAWYESTIYARVDGYVAQWGADIGDHVRKGQILATIETPDLDAQLTAVRAKLKAAQASLMAQQSDADFAKTTYQRWKDSPKGVVSEQEREAKKAGYDNAVAHVNEAQAQVGIDQADVDRYATLAQFKQVIAPYDGIITERHIDIGNLVTAGSTSSTKHLYRIEQDDPIRVFVDVPQSVAGELKVGAQAQIRAANILPHNAFDGKVTRTANAINPQTRTLQVEVDIPNADHALVPGMYVDVEFQIPSVGLAQVPAAALVFRSNGPHIALVDKDKRVEFRKVDIIRDNGNTVNLSSGVSPGDRVALNISNQILDGDPVITQEFNDGVENASPNKS